MFVRLLKVFGSLKLAVVLLGVITIILAAATFYESAESSKAATQHIYKTWWFNYGLLGLLAVNLAAAALTRWPWKRKHVGFVITHAGIIIILGGCGAAFHYGTEGMLELRVGGRPAGVVRVDDEALSVVVPDTGQRVQTAVRARKDGSVTPRSIQLTRDIALTLDKYVPNTRVEQVVEEGGAEGNPALRFRLQSEMAGQNVSDWLVADSSEHSRASVGPAQIEFVVARDADELKRLTTEAGESAAAKPVVVIRVAGKDLRFDIAANLDKHLDLGEAGVTAHIMGYWPDFRMDENHKPSTASNEPNNPAAVLIVRKGENEQRHFVFANPQMPPIVRTTSGDPIDADVRLLVGGTQRRSGVMTVVLSPDGKTLHYAAAAKSGFKSGQLPVGEPVATGWMDFQFTAEKFLPEANVSDQLVRAPENPEGGFPAIVITAHAGGEKQTMWARFSQPVVIQAGGKAVHVMYGWDTMPLPFTVELEDFIVEHDEGSDNVAGWTSKVVFRDEERGLTQRASIWMNHPAWFEGYKFSQASWNPNDLKYTALQVKKDPRFVAWLTWTGAILITGGIALMFYFRRWFGGGDEGKDTKDKTPKVKEMVTA
jgi:hypothetical protein